jgi:hypothetical protein
MMANPYQGEDVDPFSGARDEEGNIKRGSFKEAFAAARKAGDKTFMFNGKKYTTELKGAKKASSRDAEVPSPMSKTSPASMTGKERASEMARIQARGGKDRMGESAAGRVMQRLTASENEPAAAAPSRATPSFSSLGGMTMREKMAAMRGQGMKKGGSVKSSASKRADGCAMKGKTRGRMV